MSGRSPRFINLGWDKYTIAIRGELHKKYAYVQIDGQTYSTPGDVSVKRKSYIRIVVDGNTSGNKKRCGVTLNGENVLDGAGQYFLQVETPTSVTFTRGANYWYTCAITTN